MSRNLIVIFLFILLNTLNFSIKTKAESVNNREFQLLEASINEIQCLLDNHLITSEQLVTMYLKRIAAYDDKGPAVNAFIYLNKKVLNEAKQIDASRQDIKKHGPLFGIPIALKDNIDTNDMPTTAGSLTLKGSIPQNDAFITQKLRKAGAIILGKLTLTEFANFIAIDMPAGYSGLGQYGFNPYDPRVLPNGDGRPVLTPGGSSSGAGIAVTANLTMVAIGTETSGSILSPSNENGIVGIKPTVGLVSRSGIIPISADQDTAGPMARSVEDAAILLGVIAGYDRNDEATHICLKKGNCYNDYVQFLDKNALKNARIAVPPYADEKREIMENAINVLRGAGAEVKGIPPLAKQLGICVTMPAPTDCSIVMLYGQKRDLNKYLSMRSNSPVSSLNDIIELNRIIPGSLKYGQAIFEAANKIDLNENSSDTKRYLKDRQNDLRNSRGTLDNIYNGPDNIKNTDDDFDAILFSGNDQADVTAKAGYPSITVPCGFVDPVYPIEHIHPSTVTFTGPAFSEPRLIAIAYAFEQITHYRRPPFSTPALPSDFIIKF